MRILFYVNPSSGSGKGRPLAAEYSRALRDAGHTCDALETRSPRFAESLADIDLLAIVGGDGTVHSTLPTLLAHAAPPPLVHIPLGTENLFSREFGSRRLTSARLASFLARDPAPHLVSIRIPLITPDHDLPAPAAPHPFSMMWSAGPDASIIRRLAAVRTGPISHASYLRPILAELRHLTIPRITLDLDGARVLTDQPGWLVIANARQYALRIDPCPAADPCDDRFDVFFCPATSVPAMLSAFARARLRAPSRQTLRATARAIRLTLTAPRPADQMDGETGLQSGSASTPNASAPRASTLHATFSFHPQPLRVLSYPVA